MTELLGLSLDEAVALAEAAGYSAICCEVRSKKGVPGGDDKRVIRVRMDEAAKTVYLAYSVFKTDV